jgi:RNA polymerase sigma-70 factor, ECF subfamily
MNEEYLTNLIKRAQEGDVTSFDELLVSHYPMIFRFAWKWCGNGPNAEDVAQQSCIKLADSLVHFRFQTAFKSWLYQLVVSCARDWQRAQQRHAHDPLLDDEPSRDTERFEDHIYVMQLMEQLNQLGEGMKETALLVHAEGWSHAEAAEILGVAESTISWRIHAIRKHMNTRKSARSGDV